MKIFKRKLWGALAVVLATFLVIVVGANAAATKFKTVIDGALGIVTSKTVSNGDGGDKIAYPRAYSDEQKAEKDAYFKATCEEVEAEGLVLMKNDNNALPLAENSKVSLFLNGSVKMNYGSTGSSSTDTSTYKDLKTALSDQGLSVNEKLWNFYKSQSGRSVDAGSGKFLMNEVAYGSIDADAINAVAEYNVAILTFARDGGESLDLSAQKSDGEERTVNGKKNQSYLSVTAEELSVLEGLTALKEQGKVSKIIVLLNSASPMELDFLYRDGISVDACVWIGNVGITGIDAVAKTLVGKYVPSGKLSDTFARDSFSSPAMAQQAYNTGKKASVLYGNSDDLDNCQTYYGIYNEGIYVGYRYYETRYTDFVLGQGNAGEYSYATDVAYPFGYGKSYTTFAYSDLAVTPSADGKTYSVSVKVTNTGDYDGKEVVEVYLQKPYTDYDKTNKVEKAAVELVGYAKTGVLTKNGGSEVVTISVSKDQFRSYDANGAKTYIIDGGVYYLTVANGAHEAANNILAKQGKSPANTGNKMDAEGNAALAYATDSLAEDLVTYKTSAYTGEEITNRFDFADINKNAAVGNANTVTYVSRNDWVGTWPSDKINIDLNDAMKAELAMGKDIVEDPNATMPTYGEEGDLNIAKLRGKAFDDEDWNKLLNQMTFAEQTSLVTGGFYLTPAIASVSKPATVEKDGPTGLSTSSLSFPSEGIWASSYNDELIQKVGDALAEDAVANGITGLYGGGMNIHRIPYGGRAHEYFSEDPYLTGTAIVAETIGLQKKGVIAHVKHFAFNDQESAREGISIWLNEQEAREIMLYPFEMVLAKNEADPDAQAHAVMTSFNRVGPKWAGASSELLKDVLVKEWGFDGYNITDMAQTNYATYMGYKDGIPNGTNIFLNNGTDSDLDAYKDNATVAVAMRDTAHRILYTIANYSVAMNGYDAATTTVIVASWYQTLLTVLIIVFSIVTAAAVALYSVSVVKDCKAKKQ